MARPLRFRYAPGTWSEQRVRNEIFGPLDGNLGATMSGPWFRPPDGFEARRFEMDNGDVALFAWTTDGKPEAYWIGNTETPSVLWRTEKYTFAQVPSAVADWAERELLAQLHEEAPWLADYETLSWFFLPVLLSKDGRQTTRTFLRDHAAGFPEADRETALGFYEAFLATGVLDDHRYEMASKLGTSQQFNLTRMSATMGEFNAAKLLADADYRLTPEIEVTTGHSLDFRADPRDGGEATLVEVTRPLPTDRRSAGTPEAAVRDTAKTKTAGQLEKHGGGVTLFVDCTSFPADQWARVLEHRPEVHHRPAVVFRTWPTGRVEGYTIGSVPLDLGL